MAFFQVYGHILQSSDFSVNMLKSHRLCYILEATKYILTPKAHKCFTALGF